MVVREGDKPIATGRQPKYRPKSYKPPQLKEFGLIGSLTQSGSMGMPEGTGNPMGMPTMP